MKIADSHAHIFPAKIAGKAAQSIGAFYDTQSQCVASAESLLAEEKRAGISRVLVCNSAVSEHQVADANEFIARECSLHPEFVGLGSVLPGMKNYEEVLDSVEAYGLKGMKIHSDFQKIPLDLPEATELYRSCARRGLIVLFHIGDSRTDYSSPARLYHLKQQVPDLVAIAAHFGGYGVWEQSEALPMPEGIWYDTSSSLMFLEDDRAKAMLDKFGTERFLFGTDFPMWTPKTELERFLHKNLGLSEAERADILYGNFARLFGEKSGKPERVR